MDTATGEAPPASPRAAFDGVARDAVPDLGLGWVVLRNCALGGGPRVGLVLMHPNVGVALVDVVPREIDAEGRFLRALDARRFPAIFGGHPPVARVVLRTDRLRDLGRVLEEAFEALPPLALAGGDGWVRTARAAAEAEMPVAAPERRRAKRRRAFPWRPVALATAGAASAAALFLVSAWPGRDRGALPGAGVVVAMAAGFASDLLPEAAPVDDDLTAPDVAAALMSAERHAGVEAALEPAPTSASAAATAAGGGSPEPAEPTGRDQRLGHASPAAALPAAAEAAPEPAPADAGAGATAAAGPQESGGAPTAAATDGAEPSAPIAAAAAPVPSVVGAARPTRDAPPPAAQPPDAPAARAAVEPRSPPKRVALTSADTPPRPFPQAAATGNRRAAPAAAPVAESGGMGRCREILLRATMGDALSGSDKEVLRRGCQPRD